MAIVHLLAGFRANDEGCRRDKLAFEVLSGSATGIGRVSVFANETLGIRIVHCLDEGAFGFWRHGRFTDAKGLMDAAKKPGQVHVADFVGLDAKVDVVHSQQVQI
jgi:hypothetical protein